MSVIDVQNLSKFYPPQRKGAFGFKDLVKDFIKPRETAMALNNLNFSIERGELFSLLGANGAGKTTFCKILNALVIPTSGSIKIKGFDSIKNHKNLTQNMVSVFAGDVDMYMFFSWRLSIERNLEYMARLWRVPKNQIQDRVDFTIETAGLQDRRKEWFQRLSTGLKQRVYLSLPLLIQPEIVILDEPTVHLDVPTRKGIHIVVKKILVEELECTVMLTTHDLNEADKLSDRVAILKNGEIVALDKPSKIKEFKDTKFDILLIRVQNPNDDLIGKLDEIKDIDKCQLSKLQDGLMLKLYFTHPNKNLKKIIEVLNENSTLIDLKFNPPRSLEESFMRLIRN